MGFLKRLSVVVVVVVVVFIGVVGLGKWVAPRKVFWGRGERGA